MKTCSSCKKIKALSEFYNKKAHKDGKHYQCKECMNLVVTNYRRTKAGKKTVKKYRKRSKEKYRKSRYRITINGYNKLMEEQNNCCAICGRPAEVLKRDLDVDHNHLTGQLRGLLCPKCNIGLGYFDTDYNKELFLNEAIKYIKKYECKGDK